jgi:hypothetical protein
LLCKSSALTHELEVPTGSDPNHNALGCSIGVGGRMDFQPTWDIGAATEASQWHGATAAWSNELTGI